MLACGQLHFIYRVQGLLVTLLIVDFLVSVV